MLQGLGSLHELKGKRGDEALAAAWGTIPALRERCWCRSDIFRAAVRVIDEYQMLSITPWEKRMKRENNEGRGRNTEKTNEGQIKGRIIRTSPNERSVWLLI